jgi:hypothetical protein
VRTTRACGAGNTRAAPGTTGLRSVTVLNICGIDPGKPRQTPANPGKPRQTPANPGKPRRFRAIPAHG